MELTYVDNSVIGGISKKMTKYPWAEFFAELAKDTSGTKWGVLPMTLKSPSVAYLTAKRYKGIRVVCKQGDDGRWIVYGQYQPDSEEN